MATLPTREDFLARLEAQDCPVCRELITGPVKLDCGHIFCLTCAKTWFASASTCPVCRDAQYQVEPPPVEERAVVDAEGWLIFRTDAVIYRIRQLEQHEDPSADAYDLRVDPAAGLEEDEDDLDDDLFDICYTPEGGIRSSPRVPESSLRPSRRDLDRVRFRAAVRHGSDASPRAEATSVLAAQPPLHQPAHISEPGLDEESLIDYSDSDLAPVALPDSNYDEDLIDYGDDDPTSAAQSDANYDEDLIDYSDDVLDNSAQPPAINPTLQEQTYRLNPLPDEATKDTIFEHSLLVRRALGYMRYGYGASLLDMDYSPQWEANAIFGDVEKIKDFSMVSKSLANFEARMQDLYPGALMWFQWSDELRNRFLLDLYHHIGGRDGDP